MLDPEVVAAIVTASGGLLQSVLETFGHSPEPSDSARKVIRKTYDQLAAEITANSLRVLIALKQAGSNKAPSQLSSVVQAMSDRQEPGGRPFENDLTYRLKYLCLLGLAQPVGGSEFALTHLGAAFIQKAGEDAYKYTKAFT